MALCRGMKKGRNHELTTSRPASFGITVEDAFLHSAYPVTPCSRYIAHTDCSLERIPLHEFF